MTRLRQLLLLCIYISVQNLLITYLIWNITVFQVQGFSNWKSKMVARSKILIPSGWHSVNSFYDFHDISRLPTPRLTHGEDKATVEHL